MPLNMNLRTGGIEFPRIGDVRVGPLSFNPGSGELGLRIPASQGVAPFVGPLDAYTAGLQVALLPFRGFTSYEGAGLRIRDDNDNSEADAGFVGDGSLAAVSTVGSPWVRTWYNQTGSNNFGQATAGQQPGFDATTINNKPGLVFTGADDQFVQSASSLDFSAGMTLYTVLRFGAAGAWQTFWSLSTSTDTRLRKMASDNSLQYTTSTADYFAGNSDLGTSPLLITADTSKKAWLNGALGIDVTANAANSGAFRVGLDGNGFWPMNGEICAVLAYNAAHNDATRQAIEAILAAQFGITLA